MLGRILDRRRATGRIEEIGLQSCGDVSQNRLGVLLSRGRPAVRQEYDHMRPTALCSVLESGKKRVLDICASHRVDPVHELNRRLAVL